MAVKVTNVIKTTIKANDLSCTHIINQHPAGMANADFNEEIIKRFIGHQLKVSAERSNTQVTDRGDLFERDVLFIIR